MNLGVIFTAKDLASGTIKGLESNYLSLDKTITGSTQNFSKHVAAFSAGLGIMAAGVKIASLPLSMVDTAGQFETSLAKMKSVMGNLTTGEMDQLRKKALQIGVATQFDPKEAVTAMKALGSAGLSTAEVLKSVDSVVQLAGASMGDLDLDKAANTVISGVKSFGLAIDQSGRVANAIVAVSKQGKISFADFDHVIGSAGDAAKQANQSFETMLVAVSQIHMQGGTAANAAEKLRQALSGMQRASAKEGFKSLGMSVTDLMKNGKFIDLPDIMDKIQASMSKKFPNPLDNSQAAAAHTALAKIFGEEGLTGFNKLLGQTFTDSKGHILKGAAAFRAARDAVIKDTNAAKVANDAYLQSWDGTKKMIAGTVETIKITLGSQLLGAVQGGLNSFLNGFLNPLLQALIASPAAAKAVMYGLLGIGTALTAVGALITGIAGFAMISAAMTTAGITIGGTMAAIGSAIVAAIPPILIIGAIIAAAVIAWQTDFAGFRTTVTDVAEAVGVAFSGLGSLFSKGVIPDEIFARLDAIGVPLGGFLTMIADMRTAVLEFSRSFVDGFKDLGGIDAFGPMAISVKALGFAILDLFGSIAKLVGNLLGLDKAMNPGTAQKFGYGVGGAFASIIPMITMVIDAVTMFVSFFTSVSNWLGTGFGKGLLTAILVIIAALNPLIGIPLLIATNFGAIQNALNWLLGADFASNWTAGVETMTAATQLFFDDWASGVEIITSSIQSFVDNWMLGAEIIAASASLVISDWLSGIDSIIAYASTFASDWLAGAASMGASASQFAADWMAGLSSLLAAASETVQSVIQFFSDLPSILAGIFMNAGQMAADALRSSLTGVWESIKAQFTGGITVPVNVSQTGGGGKGFAQGGVIPPGYPNDTYGPAWLTSGEQVLTAAQRQHRVSGNSGQAMVRPQAITYTRPEVTREKTTERVIERQTESYQPQAPTAVMERPPIIVQVMLDGKVLAESMLNTEDEYERRSFPN
jgi:TP901 family phage tail tape measure protein